MTGHFATPSPAFGALYLLLLNTVYIAAEKEMELVSDTPTVPLSTICLHKEKRFIQRRISDRLEWLWIQIEKKEEANVLAKRELLDEAVSRIYEEFPQIIKKNKQTSSQLGKRFHRKGNINDLYMCENMPIFFDNKGNEK